MPNASEVLCLLAALWAAPAFAQSATFDRPTPIKVETRYIEASVSIEDSLKAYRGLYDDLLAEGGREVARRRAAAANDGKTDPETFASGRRYAFERGYFRRAAIGRYVSILRHDYEDGLGAHPNRKTETILWDTAARKRVSVRPFFKETKEEGPAMQALAKAIRAAVIAEKKARGYPAEDTSLLDQAIKPRLLGLGPLSLAPSTEAAKASGFSVYFAPYYVGGYAEGDYSVFVPWTTFKQHLSARGALLFGGERPADDAKNF